MRPPQDAPDGSEVVASTPHTLENVATVPGGIVACICGAPLPPKRGRGGKPRRYCSDRCRVRAWDARHPRLVGGRKRPRRLWRVVDRTALPADYVKAVPDTLAIGKALEAGEHVPGVKRLLRPTHRAGSTRPPSFICPTGSPRS